MAAKFPFALNDSLAFDIPIPLQSYRRPHRIIIAKNDCPANYFAGQMHCWILKQAFFKVIGLWKQDIVF